MALVDLELARQHCRAESDDDTVLTVYLEAAESHVLAFLNRAVYATQSALNTAVEAGAAGPAPMVVNGAIRSAILLMCGHLYANREEEVTGTITARLGMGVTELLLPYRRFAGTQE